MTERDPVRAALVDELREYRTAVPILLGLCDLLSRAEAALRDHLPGRLDCGDLTKLAAECHRTKWQFDFSDESRLPVGQARDMVKRAFGELHRIGDMALKMRDAALPSVPDCGDYVLMPREATRSMTMAGCDMLPSCEHVFGHAGEILKNAYRKMVEVAALPPTLNSGAVPERETFWLAERIGHGQYAKDRSGMPSLTSDPWRATRFDTEKEAFYFILQIAVSLRDEMRPIEHMFINKPTREALPRVVDGGAWQPIETAPKDGTRVLVAESGLWMTCARYWPCNSYWIEDAASGLKLNPPTHWMPAPALPRSERSTPNEG